MVYAGGGSIFLSSEYTEGLIFDDLSRVVAEKKKWAMPSWFMMWSETNTYSLRPKISVFLEFKSCPSKSVVLYSQCSTVLVPVPS